MHQFSVSVRKLTVSKFLFAEDEHICRQSLCPQISTTTNSYNSTVTEQKSKIS